ncbi:MAG TPA: SSI family serine proteinase inhibitor [Actinophytocola sp.]|uniref:SSI family serine proteinase inhibitor n=1 Tax=Actinophytocola sp. TaxID=1872138 RepID=UPI002DDD03FD|nr:SSI family serine proteinase inhibitor [Actinophytocola sp.]HEV2784625.1 SSI family serine proteinase inhibitor [Actinophytocola sp.]
MTRSAGVLPAAISVLLALVAPAGEASAAAPPSTLVLSVRNVMDGSVALTRLRCHPPGGAHPNAAKACADLDAAGGDLDLLPGDPEAQLCTLEYRPVMAAARGTWRGRPIRWSHEYGNNCAMRAATGPVFAF